MENNNPLQIGEFSRAMKRLDSRFDSIDAKFDRAFAAHTEHAERIATLEAAKKAERKKTFSLTGAAVFVGAALAEGLKRAFGF